MSSALIADDILIKASVRAIYNKKYHCEDEINLLRSRISDSLPKSQKDAIREKIALRPKVKGCGYTLKNPIDVIGSYIYKTCLCKLTHPFFDTLIFMARNIDKGILPFKGGYLDQPAQVMELIEITKHAEELEIREAEKQELNKQKLNKKGK